MGSVSSTKVYFSVLAADGKVDRFGQSNQASLYSKYRPRYSSDIVSSIANRVRYWDTYIDWACGSGQLTDKLAPKFENTYGIDKSFQQLKHMDSKINRIVNSDFNLDVHFKAGSVDLITVAQAFHWLTPHEKLFCEVERLLKPYTGLFVIVGYTRPFVANRELNEIWEKFYFDQLGNFIMLTAYEWDLSFITILILCTKKLQNIRKLEEAWGGRLLVGYSKKLSRFKI